ncbi:putative chitinase [Luteimonas cucumeris]|uniref:Putative chitinase n=1 Tax=Luteimonas cucumeris TaxID=985012 RepID=A0A562LAI8_9GAMM|nr:glycoside hydrolase family 19 protein [Luteimonas cucumeris]TWI04673.1 putative chitinase [Luteimonas cucumeris]
MADESPKTPEPIRKWAYPFKRRGDPKSKDAKAAEVTDPSIYFEALATAEDGFYPIGANGLWHGGIHFGSQTGNVLAQDEGVRCIADGEVIAYRIDSAYPQVEYECGKAIYSKGFVLVKHRLQLPPAPKKTATDAKAGDKTAASQPATPDSRQSAEEPTLTFFSLYMHLLDWTGHEAGKALARPAFWNDSEKRVVDKKAVDKNPYAQPATEEKGIRIRQGNSSKTPAIGWLPPGARITLEPGTGAWRKIASVDSEAMQADPVHAALADAPLGWVYTKELDVAQGEPKTKDSVHVLDKPAPIKAGDLIGYLGQYQRYVDTSAMACKDRPLLHVEIFSGDDVQSFIDKSRARGKELDARQKTLLVLDKGTRLVLPAEPDQTIAAGTDVKLSSDSPKSGDWAKVQQLATTPAPTKKNPNAVKQTPTGEALWVQRTVLGVNGQRASTAGELQAWKQFPLQSGGANGPQATYLRVAAIKTLKRTATDDKGVRWWEIDVDTPDANGNTLGWACETGHLQSPWEWPGFEIVSETAVLTDLHGKQIINQRLDTSADKDDFKAKAERAKEGALFQKLYDVIDADKKDGLTTDELRAALKKPWLAQTISRVIARYESEWGGDMCKWDELDPHMGDKANDWAKEKGRIRELQWWNELKGKKGLPEAATMLHMHPIAVIANFNSPSGCCELTTSNFRDIFGDRKIFNHKNMPTDGDSYDANIDKFVDLMNSAFTKYGFENCLHKQHFLAQCYHESDHFNTTIEYASGSDYDISNYPESYCTVGNPEYNKKKCRRRKQILAEGNTSVGDGPTYKGKGIIQLTWKGTYQKYEDYSGTKVVSDPMLVSSDLTTVIDSAFWFWTKFKGENINAKTDRYYAELSGTLSDEALHDEVVKRITKVVNGGDRGLSERQTLFKRIREKLK